MAEKLAPHSDTRYAWRKATDRIFQRYALDDKLQLEPGYRFVWFRWFVYSTWHLIGIASPSWSRRHIKADGSDKTLCRQYCDVDKPWKSRDWFQEPAASGPIDECPECRGMMHWLARKNAEAYSGAAQPGTETSAAGETNAAS